MLLRSKKGTVDLRKMNIKSRRRGTPTNTATSPLIDGKWLTQERGQNAPKWTLTGEFPSTHVKPTSTGKAQWDTLVNNLREEWDLIEVVGGSQTTLATCLVEGTPSIEEPDLINGLPIYSRWRITLVELPPK